jgi:hypothetical protein
MQWANFASYQIRHGTASTTSSGFPCIATECWLGLLEKQHQAICDYAGCEVVELNDQRDDSA